MKKIKNIIKNPYFIISITYLLAHVFLLLLSGCWWDDWTFMSHNLTYINEVAVQSGRPEWNLLIPLCWSLPNNGRILIFFLYYLDSLFIYNILKDSTLFNDKDSLLISLMFTVIPVNDARLLISNFPYSVGLFLFLLSFMLFIKWNNSNKRKLIFRIFILLLFFISFILNSLLVYYYVIFIYLFILDYKKNTERATFKNVFVSIKNVVIKYIDFFILPFVYFISNKLLFPVTGIDFEARSSITLSSMLKCFKYLPLSIINIFKEVYSNMFESLDYWPISIVCLIVVIIFVLIRRDNSKTNKKYNIIYVIFGFIILSLALFAYVEVRNNIITTNGVKGRDTILVPLGLSIIIVFIYSLLKEKIKTTLSVLTILLCIVSFNLLYIEWQKDYYCQLSMENLLKNEIIKNNDTFFLANLNETDVEGERYYTLNINAYHVYNDETRLFIPKASNLVMLESINEIEKAKVLLNGSQMMKDYNPEDYNIDAVLIYENDISTLDVLRLKYNELFDINEFNKQIKKLGKMIVVEVDDGFTAKLLLEFNKGNINDDLDIVELLEFYYN